MQSTIEEATPDAAWAQIAPILDEAVSHLGETDRAAVVLRYFENKSLAEVGAALGASEDAAKKRLTRALEKLRKIFAKRGVTLTAAVIAGAVAANSVQAAPAGLALKISAVAVAKGAAAGTTTLMLVKGALKLMAWSKAKTAIVVCAGVLIAAGVATLTLTSMPFPKPVPPVAEPSRVMNQIAEPLDLSAYYEQDQGLPYGPQGLQTFEHVPLQIGGMMLLWGANNAKSGAAYAEAVLGVGVNRKFETLYVYHATFYGALEQEPVYDLVFRYEDGSSATNEILYDEDVLDFYINKGPANLGPIGPRSKLVWLGQLAYGEKKQRIRFFLTAVENPQPSLKVVTIDLYSCKTTAAACIQAMTTGPSGLMQ
jgi:hypothetical protein